MIGTLRKHSTWLWIFIIVAIIITFVWWGTPQQQAGGDGRPSGDYGSINGQKVSAEEFAKAWREFSLFYFFRTGDWPDGRARLSEFEMQREAYFRLLLIRLLDDYNIHASSEDVAKAASEQLRGLAGGRTVPLESFANEVLRPRGLTAEDFARYVRHNLGIEQLVTLKGLAGRLVTPEELRSLYRRENQEVAVQAVFFSASNHLDEVTVTPEAIEQFYLSQTNEYLLPDRVQITYVRFSVSNYLAEAEQELNQSSNLIEQLEIQYLQLGPDASEEAKQEVRTNVLQNIALNLVARKAASDFARELYAKDTTVPEELGKLAGEKGLTVHLSEPFGRDFAPDDLKVPSQFARQAFGLSAEIPFAGPLLGQESAYVIALHKKLPSEIPPLEQIRERVTEDYKLTIARSLARQEGAKFAATLAAGLPNQQSFASIASNASVQPVMIPPFSLRTTALPQVEDHTELFVFKQAVFSVSPGKATEFVPTLEGGFVAYMQDRLPLDEQQMEKNLPQFAEAVRRARMQEAFSEWFFSEAQRSLGNIPALRQPAPQPQAAL